MKNFTLEEYVTDLGSTVVLTALDGLIFENGEKSVEVHIMPLDAPRIGETVMIDGHAVTVAERRWSADHTLHVMDEDTRTWYRITKKASQ